MRCPRLPARSGVRHAPHALLRPDGAGCRLTMLRIAMDATRTPRPASAGNGQVAKWTSASACSAINGSGGAIGCGELCVGPGHPAARASSLADNKTPGCQAGTHSHQTAAVRDKFPDSVQTAHGFGRFVCLLPTPCTNVKKLTCHDRCATYHGFTLLHRLVTNITRFHQQGPNP